MLELWINDMVWPFSLIFDKIVNQTKPNQIKPKYNLTLHIYGTVHLIEKAYNTVYLKLYPSLFLTHSVTHSFWTVCTRWNINFKNSWHVMKTSDTFIGWAGEYSVILSKLICMCSFLHHRLVLVLLLPLHHLVLALWLIDFGFIVSYLDHFCHFS